MENYLNLLLFTTFFVAGMLLSVVFAEGFYYYNKHHERLNHFSWMKYLFTLLMPVIGLVLLAYRIGYMILFAYVLFSIAGILIEWVIGFTYHKVTGSRMSTYHIYDLTNYTSYLKAPFWGMAGVMFVLLANLI